MESRDILDNIDSYSAQDLAQFIKRNIVTLDECRETGRLSASKRRQVEQLLSNNEETDWLTVKDSNNISDLSKYLQDYPEGMHSDEARNRIAELQKHKADRDSKPEPAIEPKQSTEDSKSWNGVDMNDIDALRDFIRQFPRSPHAREARKRVNELSRIEDLGRGVELVRKIIIEAENASQPDLKLIELFEEYNGMGLIDSIDVANVINSEVNILPAATIKKLCKEGIISYDDLTSMDKRFVSKLMNFDPIRDTPVLSDPAYLLDQVKEGYSEVYFWGVPSSGKTCALGAIMSAAKHGKNVQSFVPDADCQGAAYMGELSDMFKEDEVIVLPPRTSTLNIYEMRYTMVDEKDREHKLAFIDLAGELFECMYRKSAGKTLNNDQKTAMQVLDNILVNNRSINRKIHFFVIEYGAENERFKKVSQETLLSSAMSYIRDKNVFDETTDGVYIIVTKSDKAEAQCRLTGETLQDFLRHYFEEHYDGFYRGLQGICKRKEINKGEVKRLPFSIGDVCMQNFCLFDMSRTSRIIEVIKNRSYAARSGFFGKITKKASE